MKKIMTTGVCAKEIWFETDGDTIKHVEFIGGCPGNAIGLSNMVVGEKIAVVVEKLRHVKCGAKDTSCPSQLALALERQLG